MEPVEAALVTALVSLGAMVGAGRILGAAARNPPPAAVAVAAFGGGGDLMSGGLSKMIVSPLPRADCDADVSPHAMVGCDADGTSEPLARSAAADEGRNGPAAL